MNKEKNKADGNGNGNANFDGYIFARFSKNVPTHVLNTHVSVSEWIAKPALHVASIHLELLVKTCSMAIAPDVNAAKRNEAKRRISV